MKKSISLPFLAALLVAAALSSCSPARSLSGKREVTATNEILGWEKEIAQLERLDSLEQYPENAVLFTGSSSIRLWKTIQEDMTPYTPIQRGFGGAKIEDMVYYLPRIVFPHRFSAVVFFIGTNNIQGNKGDYRPRDVAALAEQITGTVRARYPQTPIFWIAITPTSSRWKAWGKIRQANTLFRRMCENNPDTYYIDTADAFLGPDGRPNDSLFIKDRLHLNREGYRIWASVIKAGLDKVLNRP